MAAIKWNNASGVSGAGAEAFSDGVGNLNRSLQNLVGNFQDQGKRNTENYNRQSGRNDDQIAEMLRSLQNPEEFDAAKASGALSLDAIKSKFNNQFDVGKFNSGVDSTRGKLVQQDKRQDQDKVNEYFNSIEGNGLSQRENLNNLDTLGTDLNLNAQDKAKYATGLQQQMTNKNKLTDEEDSKFQMALGGLQGAASTELEKAEMQYQANMTNLPVDQPLTTKQEEMTVESVLDSKFKTENGKDSAYKKSYLEAAKKNYIPKGAPKGSKGVPVPGYVLQNVIDGLSFEGETGAVWSNDYRIDAANGDVFAGDDVDLLNSRIADAMEQHLQFEKNRELRLGVDKEYSIEKSNINASLLQSSAAAKAKARANK